MRRPILGWILFAALAVVSTEAAAWDFSMTGELEWRYRYWTRTGRNDIFGTMGDDVYLGINHLETFPTAATTNRGSGAFGVLAGENRFGADMSANDLKMSVFPKIRVTRAIEITAGVNLTSLGIWSDGEPLDSSGNTNVGYINSLYVPIQDRPVATNVPNTYLTLQWLKLQFRTPILDFALGYRTTHLGMGLWKSECSRASASIGISALWPVHVQLWALSCAISARLVIGTGHLSKRGEQCSPTEGRSPRLLEGPIRIR